MKVSIVMASYLGDYPKAAKHRDKKILRAIDSVMNQTYKNIECIVVADGCDKTVDIVKNSYLYSDKVKGYKIEKQTRWSGVPRNTGIYKATGEWICYLDVDDYFKPGHVAGIVKQIASTDDWLFFDDWVANREGKLRRRPCALSMGKCGTSNIIHRKIALWNEKGSYAHDWQFIKNLRAASRNHRKIVAGEYVVCHIPGRLDA